MKCPICKGKTEYFKEVYNDGKRRREILIKCNKCNGTGEMPMTNEEWFCQLPTEEKAEWLYDHYVNARADEYYGRQEKTLSEYQKWLVDVHKEIDGTRVS